MVDRSWFVASLLAFSALACREAPKPVQPEALIERVEVAGCRQILRGPICELEEAAELIIWVQTAPESELTVRSAHVAWIEVDGGRQTTLHVGTATRSIVLVATRRGTDLWELPIRNWQRPEVLREADRIRARSATTALAILDGIPGDAEVRVRAEAAALRARIAFATGQLDASVAFRRQSVALGDEANLISAPIFDLGAIAFVGFAAKHEVELTREALGEAKRRLPEAIGPEAAYVDYYEAALARETGDLRSAIRLARRAEKTASHLRDPIEWGAVQLRADALGVLGLHDQVAPAYASLAASAAAVGNPCALARLRGNRAWVSTLARETGKQTAHDPMVDGAAALELFTTTCPQPNHVANVAITLALAATQNHDLEAARSYLALAKAREERLEQYVHVWLMDVEARVELMGGAPRRALATYDRLEKLAAEWSSPTATWRAVVGRAFVYQSVKAHERARREYERGEALLDRVSLVPFGGAEEALLVDARDTAARRQAGLLLKMNAAEAALDVLDRHAARATRGLERGFRVAGLRGEARRRWEHAAMRHLTLRGRLDRLSSTSWKHAGSKDEAIVRERRDVEEQIAEALASAIGMLGPSLKATPPHLAPDELRLTFDRTSEGWVAFGRTDSRMEAIEVGSLDPKAPPEALSGLLLEPFAALAAGRSRLHITARGDAGTIDFHGLPWRGAPLVASYAITYGTDAPALERETRARRAVVVSDPRGDLPGARDEATAVSRKLREAGWEVVELTGRAVTRSALTEVLEGATLLHWAGHAHADPEVGFSAALPLAGGAALEVGDILSLTSVPSRVVLSGCETAPPATREIGPARAFVLAGAGAVIATTRPVRDADALTITSAIYDDPSLSLPEALQHVQKVTAASKTSVDWAAFRVYVP